MPPIKSRTRPCTRCALRRPGARGAPRGPPPPPAPLSPPCRGEAAEGGGGGGAGGGGAGGGGARWGGSRWRSRTGTPRKPSRPCAGAAATRRGASRRGPAVRGGARRAAFGSGRSGGAPLCRPGGWICAPSMAASRVAMSPAGDRGLVGARGGGAKGRSGGGRGRSEATRSRRSPRGERSPHLRVAAGMLPQPSTPSGLLHLVWGGGCPGLEAALENAAEAAGRAVPVAKRETVHLLGGRGV